MFVSLPRTIYREYPNWVPPLWHEEKKAYDAEQNVMLRDNPHQLFILLDDGGSCIGRVIAYVDHAYNNHTGSSIGFFGAYEAIDDRKAAAMLLQAAADWLTGQGVDRIRGPIHPIAESWGFLLEGYDSLPVLMAPYNPPYYHAQMLAFGLEKVKDLYAYEADAVEYQLPERITRFTELLLKKHPELTLRRFSFGNLMRDAEFIWHITNTALADNWGYVPVEEDVMVDMVHRLKPIFDPEAVWFVEDYGRPVGFALGFPDPNPLIKKIKGKLFPFGFLRFTAGRENLKRYRLLSLAVLPEYHGMGLDVLLYKALYDALAPRKILLEANYILEDNWNIRNALEKLELEQTKSYRIYEKAL